MANVVDGTTISTSRTAGLEITLATENPVDITSTGRIVTTGLYAIEDTVQAVDAITNSGKLQGQYGVDVYGAGSPIVNYGSIAGTAGDGVFFIDSGTLTNGSTTDKTASISGSAAALGIRGSTRPDTVTNYGSLVSANKAVSDTGTTLLTVNNYGKISGTNGGGIVTDGTLSLSNFGSITGGSYAYEGGKIVNGSTTDTTASITGGDAIFIGGTTATTVTNFGNVEGADTSDGDGITSNGSAPITIVNGTATDKTASISGGFDGIATIGRTVLTNFGSIKGSNGGVVLGNGGSVTNGSAADTTASIAGGVRIDGGPSNSLTNFGTITNGAFVESGGTVTNGSATDRTASISGPDGGDGVVIGGPGGDVINYGTIGAPSAISISGTVVNYGLISSLGTPYPAINFDYQPGELIEEPGSTISGPITEASDTTLVIANGGSGPVTGATVSGDGFGAVAVDAGVTWTVSSVEAVPTITNDGTIVISTGDRLDASIAVNPSSTGIFQLTGKSSLEIAAVLGSGTKVEFLGATPSDELIIDKAMSFGAHVGTTSYAGPLLEDFKAGDVIDLKGIAATGTGLHYVATSGDLQITGSSGNALATLAFQSSTLGAGSFHAASDGSGGTLITHS
jgi:hypothetical protein